MDCRVKPSNDGSAPRTQRSAQPLRSGALQSRGPFRCRKHGSRFCEAALRKCYGLHRARTRYTYRAAYPPIFATSASDTSKLA
jgi:hypothetical protein